MPQLSPMMGVLVFLLTNMSFISIVLSVRGSFNAQELKGGSEAPTKTAFRGFS